ncbi:MAG TPA: hypothetical protein VGR11_02190 [Solirubrobacteraceae bacterium]|nr:hypothetical protein [Solirubrobacteraceae bacterium]
MHLSRDRLTRSIVAAVAAGALVAGCGGDDADDAAGSQGVAATPVKFPIRATAEGEKKALEFPPASRPGWW